MMHNKKLSWLSLTLLLVLALTALVARGVSTDAEEKILGVSGLKESYYQGQELDFADVVVTYQDVNGEEKTVAWGDKDLSISLDVAETSDAAEVVVTYGKLEYKATVAVMAVENVVEINYVSGIEAGFVGAEQDFSDLLIKVTMENGDEITMKKNDHITVEVAENEAENKAVATISLAGITCQREYSLVRYYVTSVLDPQFWSDYLFNTSEKENKRQEYKDRTRPYLVGTMNGFLFSPKLKVSDYAVLDDEGEPVKTTLDKTAILAKVYLLDAEGNATLLEGDALAQYVAVDEANASFQFTEAAIGKAFKLSALSKLVTAGQIEAYGEDAFTVSVEVTVVDGYNCYTAADLSLFDNRATDKIGTADASRPRYDILAPAWDAFRAEHGITTDPDAVHALILHANMSITVDDIPSAFIYHEGDADFAGYGDEAYIEGTMRDELDIYFRLTDAKTAEQFSFYGNYFTVDAQELPLIMREGLQGYNEIKNRPNGEYIISHTTLFLNVSKNDGNAEGNDGFFYIENANFTGNLNKSEQKMSGGMMLFKPRSMKAEYNNIIADRWFITSFADDISIESPIVFNKCKFYDDYNSFLFISNGCAFIKDSELIGAGGPVAILDHWWTNSVDEHNKIPQLYVDGKSTLESWVAGTEGWFTLVGATSFTQQLGALDAGLQQYGSSFMNERDGVSMMNAVAVIKKGGAYTLVPEIARGKFYHFNSDDLDACIEGVINGTLDPSNVLHCMDTDETYTKQGLNSIRTAAPGNHIFQGSIPMGMATLTTVNLGGQSKQLFAYYDFSLKMPVAFHPDYAPMILPQYGLSEYPAYAPAFLQGPYLNIFIGGTIGVAVNGYHRVGQ